MEHVVYHALSIVAGFCVVRAAGHAWIHGTVKWPITYLALTALSLHVRQIIYHEMVRKVLIEIAGSHPKRKE